MSLSLKGRVYAACVEKSQGVWEQDLGCNYRADVAIGTYIKKDAEADEQKINRKK